MKKMESKMNNKGFSLVELIIVVAIMAILVGILAPQYIKYVEKSRISSDKAMVQEIEGALQVLASDPDADLDSATAYEVSFNDDGEAQWGEAADVLDKSGTVDTTKKYVLKSSTFKEAAITVTLEYGKPEGSTATEDMWFIDTANYPDLSTSGDE